MWLPSLTIMCAQTSLSGSAHPPCAHRQSNGKGSHSVLWCLQKRSASTGTCEGSIPCPLTHQQNYLLSCDFQSHGPRAVLSRTELSRTTGTVAVDCGCCVRAQKPAQTVAREQQLKLFRQGKNQMLELKTSRQTLRQVHSSGVKLSLHIEAHV